MPRLTDKDWETLVQRIADGRCTPFLGAGASFGVIPLGSELANEWAKSEGFPLEDSSDLAHVAQYASVIRNDRMALKEEIQRRFRKLQTPDFNAADEPHAFLADLPLPIYMTTNYDGYMFEALKSRNRSPKREICRWNGYLRNSLLSVFDPAGAFIPSSYEPVVFHLHGHYETPESLVLTDDDYLDFMIGISRDQALLPERIREAFTGTSLLFMGYRLADPDFRMLFRSLVEYLEKSIARGHVSVQLSPSSEGVDEAKKQKIEDYFDTYFNRLNIRVYWGSCRKFITELKERWQAFKKNGQ